MYTLPRESCPFQLVNSTSQKTFAIMSTVLISTGSTYGVDHAEVWRCFIQPRISFYIEKSDIPITKVSKVDVRSPAQHINNIRSVLDLPISDLANLLDVSRQAVYKWISNSATPESEKFDRIAALSRIADKLEEAHVSRAGSLLKMKTFDGYSLLDLLKSGEDCHKQVQILINEASLMESSYLRSGLASSKAEPTSDWQSYVSIPGSLEE